MYESVKGKVFGVLTVIAPAPNIKGKCAVTVSCECGVVKVVRASDLKSGKIKSCGVHRTRTPRHGHARRGEVSKVHMIWQAMRGRCNNPNNKKYPDYGGRGIVVCQEWGDFETFLRDMGEPPLHHSLERINNDLGYSKTNCKWATAKEQGSNKRNNVYYEYMGEKLTLPEISRRTSIRRETLRYHVYKGRTVCDAINRIRGH